MSNTEKQHKKQSKKKSIAALLCMTALCAALLFTGCANGQTPAEKSPVPPTGASSIVSDTATQEGAAGASSAQGAATVTGALRPVHRCDGTSIGSGNDAGFYFINTVGHADGSTNLMYLDYATKQKIDLCSQPNCTHQTDTCAGYVPPNGGGAVPVVVGQQLVLVSLGNSAFYDQLGAAALPQIETMSLDGSGRKMIATFAANQTIDKPFLADDVSLYFRLATTTEDGKSASIVQLNTVTGTLSEFAPLNHLKNERIWGCTQDKIVLYRYQQEVPEDTFAETPAYEIALRDSDNLDTTSVYAWTQGNESPVLFDDDLVFFDAETRNVHVLNLDTQQEQRLPEIIPPENVENTDIIFYEYKDNRLLYNLRVWKPGRSGIERNEFFAADLTQQTTKPFSLQYTFSDEPCLVSIVAEKAPDAYLVVQSEAMTQIQHVGEDGVSHTIPAPVRQYALIEKEAYWNSNPAYNTFSE